MREEELPIVEGIAALAQDPVASPPSAISTSVDASPVSKVQTAAQRFVALDLLRFLAVILMVQGHTFREVLEVAIREQRWHGVHNYIHGYTAPIFLFSSGLAFGITTFRSWDKHLGFGPTLFKRLERYVLIILIGYALHIPRFSLTGLFALPHETLGPALAVDALQNIGFTLLLAELSVVALRSQKRFVALIVAAMVALVLAAPALWRLELPELHPLFTGYVNSSTGSVFPIAPWAAFLLAGILTAYVLWDPVRRSVRPNAHFALLGVGLATIVLGKVLSNAGIDSVFGEHNYWKTSPYFFVLRIGAVWSVLALLMIGAKVFARAKSASRPGLVQTLGQETLVIYVAHLFVLYGSPFSPGVVPLVGKTLSVVESTLLFGAVFCAMIATAIVWHEVKTRFPVGFNHTRRMITAALVLLFVFSS